MCVVAASTGPTQQQHRCTTPPDIFARAGQLPCACHTHRHPRHVARGTWEGREPPPRGPPCDHKSTYTYCYPQLPVHLTTPHVHHAQPATNTTCTAPTKGLPKPRSPPQPIHSHCRAVHAAAKSEHVRPRKRVPCNKPPCVAHLPDLCKDHHRPPAPRAPHGTWPQARRCTCLPHTAPRSG